MMAVPVKKLTKYPPASVRKELRTEVGFCCPVKDCGNPFLFYHHFDPPWREKKHHNPNGMISLCAEHHTKADKDSFTKDQLRELKQNPYNNIAAGKFDWLRNELIFVAGTNVHFSLEILKVNDKPVIWFNRDKVCNLLLNIRLLSLSGEERAIIKNNEWVSKGSPSDLQSPPMGRFLRIDYDNGDHLQIEFSELNTIQESERKYENLFYKSSIQERIHYPITTLDVQYRVAGTSIDIKSGSMELSSFKAKGCIFQNGININTSLLL